ncbi:hypothetical protein TNCT_637911 [Trichonephila clavata]|uniref:Large ribosomal subunit protein mL53 n=1 Tax=Trichonephila clavata TaxID=2740835 RepID=A0A8X6M6A0_TRICU|nr:hypothetical protein TNCT_637911 [Trichonephila clavata]
MAARVASNFAVRFFYAEVKKFHLRPVKKLSFQFDPFHENAKTVRDFYFHISSKKIRKTNQSCVFKADVVNDRSEPTISVDLSNGLNVLFKCSNLSTLEVAKEFNHIIEKYDVKEEDTTIKLKGALQKETKAKKRK